MAYVYQLLSYLLTYLLRSSHVSVVNEKDLCPVSLGSIPMGPVSLWWWQKGQIAPVRQ